MKVPEALKSLVAFALLAAPLSVKAYWGCPPPPPPHWHGGGWYGGYAVGAGLLGGLVGAAIYDAVRPTRTVVQQQPVVVQQQPVVVQAQPVVVQAQPVVVQQQQPVVVQQQPAVVQAQPAAKQMVWVEGRYISQTQADGTVVQVWNPGHYESR